MDIENILFPTSIILADPIPLHVFLVKGKNYAVWIDSGVKSMFPAFQETLKRADLRPSDVRFILHTHSHHDHIGCNAQIAEWTGCLIGAPAYYARWHADFEVHFQEFARPFPQLVSDTPERRQEVLNPLDAPRPLDFHLDEGAFYDLGGVTLQAYSLPGHMLAELGWFEATTRTLILGDAITGLDWFLFHGHYTVSGYRNSLNKIVHLLSDLKVQRVVCAHFPPMTPAETVHLVAKAHDYLDAIEVTLLRILAEKGAATLETLWIETTSRMNRLQEFRSLSMVAAHLEDFAVRGVVREVAPQEYTLK